MSVHERMDRRPGALLTCLLWLAFAASCSIDVSELQEAEPSAGGAGSPASSAGTSSETGAAPASIPAEQGSPAPDAGPDAGAQRAAPQPDETPIDLAGRTCGVVGLPCCKPGNVCELGACLRGQCTPYGGLYARSSECHTAPCPSRNAYTAGCGCPAGFDDSLLWETDQPCSNATAAVQVHACTATRTPEMAFGGLWVEEKSASTCEVECSAPNPYTAACSCPAGTRALTIGAGIPGGPCGDAARTLALCANQDGAPLNFGGFYALSSAASDGCGLPNPLTGSCVCPRSEPGAAPLQNLQVGEFSVFVCNQ